MQQGTRKDIEALGDKDRNVRLDAVQRLSETGAPAADPLIQAIEGQGAMISGGDAALALARIGQPAIGPLISALKRNRDPDFRRYGSAASVTWGR